jgi:hypothetical protein
MKAKEYAKIFLESDLTTNELQNAALSKVVFGLMQEVERLCDLRHSHSDSAVIAALKEQQDKWRAFSSIVNKNIGSDVIKPDGFKKYIYLKFPELAGRL